MDAIPPTLPFHLAKAYGAKSAPAAKPTITVTPIAPGVDRVDGVRVADQPARADRASTTDRVDLAVAKKAEAIKETLVAAVVPGGVEFRNGVALASGSRAERLSASQDAGPATASIPFYRHPADKNAAATAVDLGSRLDLEG
tara:strand:- start:662 stop:1087 length:426 start_codon:yes stop_codon:yes gene_type:complete